MINDDHTFMPFGIFKGQPFFEIPERYLKYILQFNKPPLQENLRRPIVAELQRRRLEADLDRAIAVDRS
jgi:uncharacterized protein (DUF3820 family)